MAYKVYLDSGHGGSDPGAVANNLAEKTINLVQAIECANVLKRHGVNVHTGSLVDEEISITTMAKQANDWGADLVISIHNNAGGGDGFEVFYGYYDNKSKELAKYIETEVKKIGQNSRGLKTKRLENGQDYFGMIRMTNAPAVLCEGAFLDNKTDVKIIDTVEEQKKFGVAYAKGILKMLGIEYKDETTKPASTPSTSTKVGLYRVQVGAYAKRENAENKKKELKAKGIESIIVKY